MKKTFQLLAKLIAKSQLSTKANVPREKLYTLLPDFDLMVYNFWILLLEMFLYNYELLIRLKGCKRRGKSANGKAIIVCI